MGIYLWIIYGAIAGLIIATAMETPHGKIWDIVMGMGGVLLGVSFLRLIGQAGMIGFNLYTFLLAVIGPWIAIIIGRFILRIFISVNEA